MRVRRLEVGTNSGFSLLEVVIAIGILSFGMLGLALMQLYSLSQSSMGRHTGDAASIGRSYVEQMHRLPWATLTAVMHKRIGAAACSLAIAGFALACGGGDPDTPQAKDDGVSESEALESAPIPVVNSPPKITSRPGALEDGKFRYALTAEDPDGDTQFRYRLLQGPEGMELRSGGTVVWSPEEAQAGKHNVEVEIADVKGGVASQRFVISLAFEDEGSVPAAPED